jgi:hypothetical protein
VLLDGLESALARGPRSTDAIAAVAVAVPSPSAGARRDGTDACATRCAGSGAFAWSIFYSARGCFATMPRHRRACERTRDAIL